MGIKLDRHKSLLEAPSNLGHAKALDAVFFKKPTFFQTPSFEDHAIYQKNELYFEDMVYAQVSVAEKNNSGMFKYLKSAILVK